MHVCVYAWVGLVPRPSPTNTFQFLIAWCICKKGHFYHINDISVYLRVPYFEPGTQNSRAWGTNRVGWKQVISDLREVVLRDDVIIILTAVEANSDYSTRFTQAAFVCLGRNYSVYTTARWALDRPLWHFMIRRIFRGYSQGNTQVLRE